MGGKHIRIKVNDRVTCVKKDQKNSFAPPLKKISAVNIFNNNKYKKKITEEQTQCIYIKSFFILTCIQWKETSLKLDKNHLVRFLPRFD